PIRVAFQHVHGQIPAPSEHVAWLPAEVDELVGALTARDPGERPADGAAALALVDRYRQALDAETLARRADVAPTASPAEAAQPSAPDDEDPTRTTALTTRGTVALPIGAISRADADDAHPKPRRR